MTGRPLAAALTAAVAVVGGREAVTGHQEKRQLGFGQTQFQGAGPERWAARYRREHQAALELRRQLSSRLDGLVTLVRNFECVHRYEGHWNTRTGNGYYGGLQMDLTFQRTYAPNLVRRKGTADRWTAGEQIAVAIVAHRTRGYWPWPNTARICGLIP